MQTGLKKCVSSLESSAKFSQREELRSGSARALSRDARNAKHHKLDDAYLSRLTVALGAEIIAHGKRTDRRNVDGNAGLLPEPHRCLDQLILIRCTED